MKSAIPLPLLLLMLMLWTAANATDSDSKRKIQCKTPAIESSCYWTHGHLRMGNGTPSFRLWKIGTNREMGIYSGPSIDRLRSLDNEGPELTVNVEKSMRLKADPVWLNTIP